MSTRLIWFRNDLRITDNKALYAASRDQDVRLLAVFIATPMQWQQHNMAPRQAVFIYENLLQLAEALSERGIPLIYHQCADFNATVKWLKNFCHKENVSEIFYNRQYEVNERKRDQTLEQCIGNQVSFKNFDDSVILPPGSVLNNHLQMYKVYKPFCKKFINKLVESEICSLPPPTIRQNTMVVRKAIPYFNYSYQEIDKRFPASEKAGLQRLRTFCKNKIQGYNKLRNLPAIDGTSCLSPYLAIGVLSPRQCINRLRMEYPDFLEKKESGPFCWLNELIWREFYHHLIVAYPFLCMGRPLIDWTDNVMWNDNNEAFKAWQNGFTGYPIVDAAMRQLNMTGWIHNRLRMISASFLVKDLLISWKVGEKYFMSQLLDGNLAANNSGWQWAASTGTDAAPYFRIFNPSSQGERFDPKGNFIRQWLPELSDIPDKYINNPHEWLKNHQGALNYPLPIVNHKQARQKTLLTFNLAKAHYAEKNKKLI